VSATFKAALDKLAEQPNLDLAKTLLNFNSS
jgi:hypothetical protein